MSTWAREMCIRDSITTYKNARAIIRRIDRDDLLQALVRDFVKH